MVIFSLQIDAPLSPGAKGSETFLRGITDDVKWKYRNYLFDVNKDQLKAVAERYYSLLACTYIAQWCLMLSYPT